MNATGGNSWSRDGWAFGAITIISGIVAFAFITGFEILPRYQFGHQRLSGLATIRQGLGLQMHHMPSGPEPPVRVPSHIAWNQATIHEAMSGDVKRGEFIAYNCTACHGEKGITSQKWIPNLAGQDRLVLYKQLADFRSGDRLSGPMTAIAHALTPQQSADVAAYFSSLPGMPSTGSGRMPTGISYRTKDSTERIVFAGDPTRGLPGCATCHGPGVYRLGAPTLSRQNALYMEVQLQNFTQGVRTNDIDMPMRTVSGMLKPGEANATAQAFANGLSWKK